LKLSRFGDTVGAFALCLAAALSLPGCLAGMPEPVKRLWMGLGVGLCVVAAIAVVARIAMAGRSRKRYEQAVIAVETGRAVEALPSIRAGKRWELDAAGRERWDAIEMSAYVQLRQPAELLALFKQSPKPFTTDEEAALVAARAQLETGDLEDFAALRKVWVSREGRVELWLGLEADLLVLQDQREEAILLLKRFKFDGPAEGTRLVRLGYLLAEQDPELSAKAMELAMQFGPKSSEVWLFTARHHEEAGRHKEAYAAYCHALELAPQDLFMRNQVAEFLARQAAYTKALQTWAACTEPPSMDFVWLKTLFWQRVANAEVGGALLGPCPPGALARLVEQLRKLSPKQFWDEDRLAQHTHETRDRWELLWLQVLEALRLGKDDEALTLLNLGLRSPHPMVENAIKQVLTYRRTGFFEPGVVCLAANAPAAFRTALFVRLDQWIVGTLEEEPTDLIQMIEERTIYAAICRASGWHEAATRLEAAL